MIDADVIPEIPRGVRVHRDTVRNLWVLLAPERVLPLDDTGRAILDRVDGTSSFGQIVTGLVEAYAAPRDQIAADASEFLTSLQARRFLELNQ